MVFGLVKQSMGHMDVISAPGSGTTFRIFLPRSDSADAPVEIAASPGLALAKPDETILLVEDDDDLRQLVVDLLNNLGYRVLDAADGSLVEGLLSDNNRIDILLSDVVLPGGITGPQIAGQTHPDLKVLYMSGYTDGALDQHDIRDPDTDLLKKPFTISELANKLRMMLDS